MSRLPGPTGHGAWRLPGRGRRMACGHDPHGRTGWVKYRVYLRHLKQRCRVCGTHIKLAGEVGLIESVSVRCM